MIEAVLIGIHRESQAYQFYMGTLHRATGEASRQMWQYLAAQEEMHRLKLEALLADLKAELNLERLKAKK